MLVLFFVNGALFATWASRIPGVQSERGLSDGALGLALLVLALGAVIAMPVAGLLIARIGSEKVCKVSALLFCAALPVVMVVPSKPLFFAALFCFGLGHGALDVAMNAQAVAVEKRYVLAASGLLLALLFGHVASILMGFALVGAGFATIIPNVFSAAGKHEVYRSGNGPGIGDNFRVSRLSHRAANYWFGRGVSGPEAGLGNYHSDEFGCSDTGFGCCAKTAAGPYNDRSIPN